MMSARPLHAYDRDDDQVVATPHASTKLMLVPSLPEPQQVVEFMPEPGHFWSWKQQTIAPIRYAACLVVYAAARAPVTATVAVPAAPVSAPVAVAQPVSAPVALPVSAGVVEVDIAGMTVALRAPEMPPVERDFDVVEYTRAVVDAAFAEELAAAA